MIQPISESELLELPLGHEGLDNIRLIGNRARLIESAADRNEIRERPYPLERVSDSRQEGVRLRLQTIAEQAQQRSVDRKRRPPGVRSKDRSNAPEIIVKPRVRGGECQFAIRTDEFGLVAKKIGLR